MAKRGPELLAPKPQKCTVGSGRVDVRRLGTVRIEGRACPEAPLLIQALEEALGRQVRRTDESAAVTLVLGEEGVKGKGPESYRLIAGRGSVTIAGQTPRALYYGVQTLGQLVEAAAPGPLQALAIEDWPVFAFRCYSDDISRRQVSTLADFEFLIRNLSRLKYNHYQPYIEDVICIDRHPMLGFGRGRLTRDEVAWMVEFGRRHFIEIMPQFNSLSHCEHMLARPEFAPWRFRGNPETLDPRNPEVRAFLTDVYAQMLEQFPCPYFHMGLDEARGLPDDPALYVSHANWLAELVLAAGKRPMMWHDMFVPYEGSAGRQYSPKLLDDLNHDIVLDQWLYDPRKREAEFLYEMTRRGFTVVLSPALRTFPCGDGTQQQWNATCELLRYGVGNPRVLGVNNTSWNDSGANDRHLHWRGLTVSAEMLWKGPGETRELRRANRAFGRQFLGIRNPRQCNAMAALAESARQYGALAGCATALPRALAQGHSPELLRSARSFLGRFAAMHASVLAAQKASRRNAGHLDHVLCGLERLRVGALRAVNAPKVLLALRRGDRETVERLMAIEKRLLHTLRRQFGDIWLRRHKPEGMEHADLRFCTAVAGMERLGWEMEWHAHHAATLREQGFIPLDLGPAANYYTRELAALPWGECVLDCVPWRVASALRPGENQIVALASSRMPRQPARVSVSAGVRAARLHALHAFYGRAIADAPAGTYRVVFADGTVQEIVLRGCRDVADWWMPFGHPFGGGGARRVDTAACRLAFMTGPDAFQGHGLYHFRAAIQPRDCPVERIEIAAAAPDASLLVAALTLETTAATGA